MKRTDTVVTSLYPRARNLIVPVCIWFYLLCASAAEAGQSGDFSYEVTTDSAIEITTYTGLGGSVTIPDTIDGFTVASIGDKSFYGCTGLTEVIIGDTVTNIGASAFRLCIELTNAVFGNKVKTIGATSFANCAKLLNVGIPNSTTNIGDYAFIYCSAITNVALSDNINAIGGGAFFGCTSLISFKFPNKLTAINHDTFTDCPTLTSINIPDNVTNIGDMVFVGCYGLTNVILSTNLTSIGFNAFNYCTNLSSIFLPASLTNIGSWAFTWCLRMTNITVDPSNTAYCDKEGIVFNKQQTTIVQYPSARVGNYVLPDGVTVIAKSALNSCFGLTGITLGDSVTNIEPYGLCYNSTLMNITVSTNNPYFCDLDGVLFNKDRTTLLQYPSARSGNYVVPNSVTNIGDEAFAGSKSMTGITMPSNLFTIGRYAFENCTRLTNIFFPASLTKISDYAFVSCTNLSGLYFYSDAPTLGWSEGHKPFYKDTQLIIYHLAGTAGWDPNFGNRENKTWPSATLFGYQLINQSSIEITNYTGLGGSVTIPDTIDGFTVASIGDWAFCGSTGLTEVIMGNAVTNIGASAFNFCTAMTNAVIGNSVVSIGPLAFCDCSNLVNIVIPSHVSNIKEQTFSDCSSLTNIVFPINLTNIGTFAFYGCSALTSLSFPDALRNVDSYAFSDCYELAGLTLPQNVTNIGGSAFGYCWSLTNLSIPDSVISIGAGGFIFCTNLSQLSLGQGLRNIGATAFFECIALTNLFIPSSVTNIGESAFNGCTYLANIAVDSLNPAYSAIDNILFNKERSSLVFCPNSKLGVYDVPSGVTNIANSAFARCSLLTKIEFPLSLTSMGDYAFTFCTSLTNFTVNSQNPIYSTKDGVIFNKDQSVLIQYPPGKLDTYVMPNSVTNIGTKAFYECAVTSVTLSDHLLSIDEEAFELCDGLASLVIPKSVGSIGNLAFSTYRLTSVYFEGDAPVLNGKSLFSDFSRATVYYLPRNTGWSSYYGGRPTKIWGEPVPYGYRVLSPSAIEITNCTLIGDSLSLPETIYGYSVAGIGARAFFNRDNLTMITLPNTVTNIGEGAFQNCSGLTTVTFGTHVTSIGNSAFANGTNLTDLYFQGDAPSLGDAVFSQVNHATVYYLPGTHGWGSQFGGLPTAVWAPDFSQWVQAIGLAEKYPNACGEQDDADGDGMTNLQELNAGTDPANPKAMLAFERETRPGDLSEADKEPLAPNQFALYFQSVPGKSYEVQSCAVLKGGWTTAARVTATTSQKRVVFPRPAGNAFYRVMLR